MNINTTSQIQKHVQKREFEKASALLKQATPCDEKLISSLFALSTQSTEKDKVENRRFFTQYFPHGTDRKQCYERWNSSLDRVHTPNNAMKEMLRHTTRDQQHEEIKAHKINFAHFHLSGELANGKSTLEPPRYHHFIRYFQSLIKELPESDQLVDFCKKIQSVYEAVTRNSCEVMLLQKHGEIIESSLKIPGFKDGLISEYIDKAHADYLKELKALPVGQAMIVFGRWKMDEKSEHAMGHLIRREKEGYSFTIVDPNNDHGASLGFRESLTASESGREHINPFFTIGPVPAEKMESREFYAEIVKTYSGAKMKDYVLHFLQFLNVNPYNFYRAETYCFARQAEGSPTCQMKLVTNLFKRWVGDGKGLESKKMMFALKARSLKRFEATCKKNDEEGQKYLAMAKIKYTKRCEKFEKLIAQGKISREEFDRLKA